MPERVSRARLALVLTAAFAALPAAAGAQRPSGSLDVEAGAAFTLRGLDRADTVTAVGDVDGDGGEDVVVTSNADFSDEGEARVVLSGDTVPGVRGFRVAGVTI